MSARTAEAPLYKTPTREAELVDRGARYGVETTWEGGKYPRYDHWRTDLQSLHGDGQPGSLVAMTRIVERPWGLMMAVFGPDDRDGVARTAVFLTVPMMQRLGEVLTEQAAALREEYDQQPRTGSEEGGG